ncbi:DUF1801 domain-containing protein [Flavobacterium amnicola]|uniref:DUF1801 domain-containing protein n=1 Tax=Flavobacterium amnicola TaxID=2506422 RepID=A0A4Q1K673_9FLAO|nr:DUF1801 domain-containing protein [Flavobacterium amnicola]RXR20684.1 DUF1801 domain-containing protein [Flavobacterium amnicola]
MNSDISNYNNNQTPDDKAICDVLASVFTSELPEAENKIWHAHPVWFLEGNPVVGYSKLKGRIRVLFWSGDSFEEPLLKPGSGKFKDASIDYISQDEIHFNDLKRWLQKARDIQWDYKNIVKRKGVLERLK